MTADPPPPRPPRRRIPEPARFAAFRWLAAGRFTSFLGNSVAPVALAFAVLDLTDGDVGALGLVVGARSVANVVFLLAGGVIADRLPRALVLQGSSLAAALTQGVVAAGVLLDFASIPMLVALSALNGAVSAIALPAAASLTPQTVPPGILGQANALLRLLVSGAGIGGAAIGGIVVATVGPGWGIAADAALYLLAAVFFSRIRLIRTVAPDEAPRRSNPLVDLRDGWSEFRARTWVWAIVLQFMVVNACVVACVAILGPVIADETIGRQAWGFVLAAQTTGLVVGGLIALRWQARRALGFGVLLTIVTAGPLLVLAEGQNVVALGVVMFASGIAIEQFGVAWDVSLQQNIPPDRLARVYSYDMVGSFVAIPLGQLVVGPVASQVGTRATLLGAAALVVVATLGALSSRSVRELTRK